MDLPGTEIGKGMEQGLRGKQEFSFGLVTFEVSIKYSNGVLSRKLDTEVKF